MFQNGGCNEQFIRFCKTNDIGVVESKQDSGVYKGKPIDVYKKFIVKYTPDKLLKIVEQIKNECLQGEFVNFEMDWKYGEVKPTTLQEYVK